MWVQGLIPSGGIRAGYHVFFRNTSSTGGRGGGCIEQANSIFDSWGSVRMTELRLNYYSSASSDLMFRNYDGSLI